MAMLKMKKNKRFKHTIMVYEYSSDDGRNIQTIWANLDSTKVL